MDKKPLVVAADHPDLTDILEPLDTHFPIRAEQEIAKPVHERKTPNIADFKPMHCRVFFRKDVRFGRNGMAEVTMQIPFQHRELALQLLDAVAYPMEMYLRPCGRRQ